MCSFPRCLDEAVPDIMGVFRARFDMHQTVYQHHVVKAIEYMLIAARVLADPYLLIKGGRTSRFPSGTYRMSETIVDPEAL